MSSLVLGEVETRGNTQYVGKYLPLYKPCASRRDATSEKKKKLRPKICVKIINKFSYQILHMMSDCCVCLYRQGQKMRLCGKNVTIFGTLVYSTQQCST